MEKRKTLVMPINSESDERMAFFTLRDFPTERVIFLTWPDGIMKAEGFAEKLKVLGIGSSIIRVSVTNPWEDFFRVMVDACQGIPKDSILVNISTADRVSQCALTNAAHVNGLRAVAVINERLVVLPILKFSFSNILSGKKMRILECLGGKCLNSLEEVARRTGMSLQLVSYHVNGTPKSKGLASLELVETEVEKGRVKVCLSTMGRLFMDGYIRADDE
jgi:hypothetical protein